MSELSTFYLDPKDPRLVQERALQLAALTAFHEICVQYDLVYYLAYGTLLGAIRHGGYIPWDDDLDLMMPRRDFERFSEVVGEALDPTRFFFQTPETDPLYPGPFAKLRCHHSLVQEAVSIKGQFHEGVYLDIFPLDVGPDSQKQQKWRGLGFLLWQISIRRKIQGYQPERWPVRAVTAITQHLPLAWLERQRSRVMLKDRDHDQSAYVAAYPASAADMRDCFMRRAPLGRGVPGIFQGVETRFPEDSHRHLTEIFGDYMTLPPEEARRGHHLRELAIDTEFWSDEIRQFAPKLEALEPTRKEATHNDH